MKCSKIIVIFEKFKGYLSLTFRYKNNGTKLRLSLFHFINVGYSSKV